MIPTTISTPFLLYSNQLQALLEKASKEKNPALWLYQNNARTPLFMLEALTRVHENAFGDKLFIKWHKRFKKLEDAFGQIDYYLAFEKEFKTNKRISSAVNSELQNQANKLIDSLNKQLKKKEWLKGKLFRFNIKISEYNYIVDDEYTHKINQAIKEDIENIKEFALKLNYSFSQLEEEVHETRRKLRWLSIYAQAFAGIIQLKSSNKKTNYSINYLTNDVLKSPYNILPSKPSNCSILEMNKNSFLCLSWIINQLGKIKDKGLSIEAVTNCLIVTEKISVIDAKNKAIKALLLKENTEALLLKEASNMMYQFIVKDKILDNLLIK